jgi:predicted O-methyltransferase YrrM
MAILKFARAVGRTLGLRPPARSIRIPRINFVSGLQDGSWLLFGLVRAMRPSVCVEIGSARGLSACYVGLALKQLGSGRLYAIDPHTQTNWNDRDSVDTDRLMRRNLRAFGVADYVTVIREYSDKAAEGWDRPIDMIFIDGDHSYEGVKRDWGLFVPHVRDFGVVIFHDTLWDIAPDPNLAREDMGVPRFVDDLRRQGYPVITLDQHCGISMVQPKVGGLSLVRG